MERASSKVLPGDTPLVEGVESTTCDLSLERSTMMAGMFFRLGCRRISTLALRWVMSRQATFMAVLGWRQLRGLDRGKDIEHECFRQPNAVAVIAQ